MTQNLQRSLLINTLWAFLGKFGYLLIGLITNIILVRLLGPKDFGQIGIIMFFISLSTVLMESGLSGALVRKKDTKEIDYSTIFIFNLFVSLLLMVVLISLSGYIADFYQDTNLKLILIISSLVLLINALRISQTVKLIKELQFKRKATYEIVAIAIASVVAIVLAMNGFGVWALVALQIITALILTTLSLVFVSSIKTYKFSLSVFKEFYKFGMNTTFASLLNTAFDNIYQLIIGRFFLIEQAGYFYQAKKLQEMPVGIIQSATLGVVYSTLAKLQDTPKEFNNLYHNIIKIFTILLAFMCLSIYFYADVIITILYGDKWGESIFYLKVLIVSAFFFLQEMFNRIIFKIYNKTEKILQLELFKKGIQSLTILYGLLTMSIENLLYGFLLTSVVSFFINYYLARKVQNYFRWNDFIIIIKIVLVAVFSVFLCDSIKTALGLNQFQSIVLFPGLLFFYLFSLYILNISNFYYDIKRILIIIKG